MESAIRKILAECDSHPVSGATALRSVLQRDRNRFFEAALPIIREAQDSQGLNSLLTLLLSEGMLTDALCDPSMFTLDEACAIARRLKRVDPQFDVRLLRSQLRNNGKTTALELHAIADNATGIRMLDVLAAVSDGARILPTVAQLLNHPNSYVRSKAALLVGRSNKNHKWVQERLEESDARVRANAVESLWGADTEGSLAVFRAALADADNRVVGNALLGLYRLGDLSSISTVIEMLLHPDPEFQSTAVWVMGETGDPRFSPTLAQIIASPSTQLRGAALRSMAKLRKAMAKRRGSEGLTVFAGQARRGNENTYLFTAALGSRAAKIPELHATNFVLWEDGQLVKRYSVRHLAKSEPIALGLGFARILDRRSVMQHLQERAVERALRHKRRHDVWMLLKYLSASQHNPGVDTTLPPADDDLSTVRIRFTTDPETIMDAVIAPAPRLACASDLHQLTRALIRAVGMMRGARNVILVCDSPLDRFHRDVIRETAAADVAAAAIHIIASEPDDRMHALCSHTGGALAEVSAPEEVPEALGRLYASLLNSYEVRYEPENGTAQKLKLQVYSDASDGECVIDLH